MSGYSSSCMIKVLQDVRVQQLNQWGLHHSCNNPPPSHGSICTEIPTHPPQGWIYSPETENTFSQLIVAENLRDQFFRQQKNVALCVIVLSLNWSAHLFESKIFWSFWILKQVGSWGTGMSFKILECGLEDVGCGVGVGGEWKGGGYWCKLVHLASGWKTAFYTLCFWRFQLLPLHLSSTLTNPSALPLKRKLT